MIKPFWDIGPKKSLRFESDEDGIGNDDADGDMSDVDDDLSDADKLIDDKLTSENGGRDSSDDDHQDDLKPGDYVKVIKGSYLGYFALVNCDGYGGEIEINYFTGKNKWWVLKENDFDSRDRGDLKKVDNFTMFKRSLYCFKQTLIFLFYRLISSRMLPSIL